MSGSPRAGSDRDRNVLGRAENQRPRDWTGRPLPYDTGETRLAEDHDYDTVEEALAVAVDLWNAQRYFEAHECLEDVWHHAADDERPFWQGVIQVAVACVHDQRGNPAGVVATCAKVLRRLADYPDDFHGIDVAALRRLCEAWQEEEAVDAYPSFPALPGGPWFDTDRARTPLTRQPPWQIAATARRTDEGDAT